jgi:hypothetical protein
MERFLLPWGLDRAWPWGQAPLLPHHRQGPTSTHSWPKHVSSRPSCPKSTALCGCFAPPSRGEASARGERAHELGRQARDRINADFNVDNPDTPPRASQKLIAAATLLRAMPAPSTPEARNLHREAQALIEQAAANRPKARRPASTNRGARGTMGAHKAPSPRYAWEARSNAPPTRGARRPRTGSSTRAGKRETATPATSSTLDGRAKQRRGQQQATTLGGVTLQ